MTVKKKKKLNKKEIPEKYNRMSRSKRICNGKGNNSQESRAIIKTRTMTEARIYHLKEAFISLLLKHKAQKPTEQAHSDAILYSSKVSVGAQVDE